MNYLKIGVLFLAVFFISSCTKTELETITGNKAPPDTTIELNVYEDYVNKTFILVLGREPSVSEFQASVNNLKLNGLDEDSRYDFLNTIFSLSDYKWRQVEKWRIQLLGSTDSSDVINQMAIFDFFLNDSTYISLWPGLQMEKDRLDTLYNASYNYVGGTISIRQLQSHMLNNYFYDQINMGVDNFVLSSFQHFLDRNPTLSELYGGVGMIGGNNAVLFLHAGASKDDYLNIFFNSDDYFEGAVIRVFNDYLLRAPNSLEMSTATLKYRSTLNFESIQKDVLATDEFVGIK
ncbi:MAG: hypothetical protein IPO63_14390 [Bacteroidetes bacterium]|nr:hypothetical protein [Bacteroidota bacterium]